MSFSSLDNFLGSNNFWLKKRKRYFGFKNRRGGGANIGLDDRVMRIIAREEGILASATRKPPLVGFWFSRIIPNVLKIYFHFPPSQQGAFTS